MPDISLKWRKYQCRSARQLKLTQMKLQQAPSAVIIFVGETVTKDSNLRIQWRFVESYAVDQWEFQL